MTPEKFEEMRRRIDAMRRGIDDAGEKQEGGRLIKRPKCSIINCNNIATSKGSKANGKIRFRKLCSTHYKLKQGRIHDINTNRCSVCDWLGPCDKHRIKHGEEGGKYQDGNVAVLCPNCHRLLHMEKLRLK
jgi:hypothetical protein